MPCGQRTWGTRLDEGPKDDSAALKARPTALPLHAKGQRLIGIFVVTHIDHDHVSSAGLVLNDQSQALSIGIDL